jgi:NTE family protein
MLAFEDLPKPVAFVLSGGVSLGAVQAGMLRAMLESGIQPDLLIGSSVGALNAAFLGQGFTETRIRQLTEIWCELRRDNVFGDFGLKRVVSIISQRTALASPEALHRLIAAHIPVSHENLETPVFVTATDYLSGETVILSQGNLHENLLASCAIPFVFPLVLIEGRYLVDGSISANVPLLPAEKLGARTLVVFDVGYPCKLHELPRSPLDRALHIFSIMLHRQTSGGLSALTNDATLICLPSPCPISVPSYDFSQGASLVEAGYETAQSFLLNLEFQGPGVYGETHSHGML